MVRKLVCICIVLSVFSCKKITETTPDLIQDVQPFAGAFVVNEGNFGSSNASLSYLNFETQEIANQVFKAKNNEDLGDVFQSMIIHNGIAYLAIDVSKKIVIIDAVTLTKIGEINLTEGPRYMQVDEVNNQLLVTQYGDHNLVAIDLINHQITKKLDLPDYDISGIPFPSGSDELLIKGNLVFVTNYRRPYMYVVHRDLFTVIDSVFVDYGAHSIVVDGDNHVWVGTSGDMNKDIPARLTCIDENTLEVLAYQINADDGFSNLCYVELSDKVFGLNRGVKSFDLYDNAIETNNVISQSNGSLFYGFNVNPINGTMWITDAIDYVQKGEVLQYGNDGVFMQRYSAGYIPNAIVFN